VALVDGGLVLVVGPGRKGAAADATGVAVGLMASMKMLFGWLLSLAQRRRPMMRFLATWRGSRISMT
jgi:hypothetical protein